MMAVCQAIDLLPKGEKDRISSKTRKIYELIRSVAPAVTEDVPQSENIKNVTDLLRVNSIEL